MRDVQVVCCEKFRDEEQRPKLTHRLNSAFYGIKSCLGFKVVDKYGNIIKQQCEMTVKYCDSIRSDQLEWKMKNGTVFVNFVPKQIGEIKMRVRIVGRGLNSHNGSGHGVEIPLNILYPPCSPSLTLLNLYVPIQCTAGKECVFKGKIYDVFGSPVHSDSKDICDVTARILLPKTESREQHQEQVNTIKIDVDFVVTVCFKKAGLRKVKLSANCGSKTSYRDVNVEVFPSFPCCLNYVSFTTNDAIDESFSADHSVIYRDQWSIIEATLVDSYNNVVLEKSNDYDISLMLTSDSGEEMKAEYKDATIQNERFRVLLKIDRAGKYNLSITLPKKSNPLEVFRLEDVEIKVNDAPLYLAGSKIHCPKFCIAGGRIQLQFHPTDVFGCPLPADSTSYYSLTGAISDSPVYMGGNTEANETIDFEVIKKKSVIVIRYSVLLTKSGRRRLIITDRNEESKELRTHSQCEQNLFMTYFYVRPPVDFIG